LSNKKQIEKRICLGAFAGAHGVQGHVKIKTFTQDPKMACAYGPVENEASDKRYTLNYIRPLSGAMILVKSPDIHNREMAQELAGTRIYVARNVLQKPEEDEFYFDDLIGLKIVSNNQRVLGKIKAVLNFGAGDLLEIIDIPGHKGVHVVPFTREAIPNLDIQAGWVELSADYMPDKKGKDQDL